ncbi:MAG: TolC family protein [Betaproteobacteria bacterium]|nr:TolC family protein [Betaproteobacteria bacterium]
MTKLFSYKPVLLHALMLLLSTAWSGYAAAETLSFAECVNMALKQNPDLIGSQERVNQAKAGLRQAQGNRIPKLTASEDVVGTNDALSAFGLKLSERQATFNDFGAGQFGQGLGVAPSNLNYPGFVHNFDTRLEIQAPIYTGGLITGGIQQARAYVEAAQQGDLSARQHVIFQVLQAYEGVHAARAFVGVTQQAETAARSLLTMMNNMLKSGTVVKSDLLLAQVRLQDVQVQHLQAQNALDGALEQLHVLLGVPFEHPLDVGEWAEIKPIAAPIQTLRQTALENNPGILALRKQTQAETAKVDMARAAWMPQVGLMLRQDWNDAQMGLGASSYTIGGSVSWVAFDGGVTHAKVDQAQASKNETQARLTQAEAGLAYQVDEAVRKADEAEKQLAEREAALSQIEEAVRLVNKRYANGLTTITEQLGAQAQLDKARADVVTARYAVAVQRANLKLALGQLDPDAL